MRSDFLTAVGSILLAITSPAAAQTAAAGSETTGSFPSLTGTWRSKSGAVLTGPGFYDPVNDRFIEPALTGISYSFTDDGWYEEAYYRAVSNPTTPSCPQGIMQWQHGRYTVNTTGSIFLTPITVDGRQQTSDPCSYKYSSYVRYKQAETFERYEIQMDTFHNIKRLNLYEFDGTPMMPLYIAFQPPQMLPTMTLNPTTSGTAAAATLTAAASSTAAAKRKTKREAIEKRWIGKQMLQHTSNADAAWFWYAGLGFSSLGLAMYLYNG